MRLAISSFLASAMLAGTAYGQTVFALNQAGFESSIGQHEIFDFESIPAETNIGDLTFDGIKFTQIGSPLIVVRAEDTYTPENFFSGIVNLAWYKLPATSGQNILSPGGVELGSGPSLDQDSLQFEFLVPQRFFGFDHLSQSADGWSFTSIALYDKFDNLLFNSVVPITGILGGPGKADFWGIEFQSEIISRVLITESDFNLENPDANIGIDSIRYSNAVPEPMTGTLVTCGIIWIARRKRKQFHL